MLFFLLLQIARHYLKNQDSKTTGILSSISLIILLQNAGRSFGHLLNTKFHVLLNEI